MSKLYYNGVLLPEIPSDVLAKYPICLIYLKADGTNYRLLAGTKIWYVSNNIYIEPSTYVVYTATLSSDAWVYETQYTDNGNFGLGNGIKWSNFDIPNGSSISTDVYLAGSCAILESARLISVEKIEAETGTLTGSAVVDDRTSTSGNIVVDCIQASTAGTLTLNFTVPKSDYYVIRMYFTHSGTRDFKYVLNGKTYLRSVVGTSFYSIGTVDFQMYLNEGSNSVLFKGGTTGYAPMFDSFEILEISTNITKYLVRNNDTIYTVTDGALAEVVGDLNAQLFIDNGVDAIPDGTLLMTLSNPEVLCWTDAETLPTLTATVKGIPEPQIVMSKEIDLMHSSIKGINGVTVDCKGDVLFAVSFDKKATWMMHNGTEFVEVSDKLAGMTKTEFEAITAEQWKPKYEASSDMYIRCILFNETQSITTVNVDFIN